jgi:2-keto-3-deoxy-L-rhamnonate aldolase RhmA
VKSSYEVLAQDLTSGYDTICDDASVVGDDVDNLEHDLSSLQGDVKTTSDAGVLDDDIRDLRRQVAAMRSFDPSMLPDDAPTQDDVNQAISAARRKVRAQGRQGANFPKAQALLAKAQAIKAQADAACQAHGA